MPTGAAGAEAASPYFGRRSNFDITTPPTTDSEITRHVVGCLNGLRRKQSVMLRPNACIVPFEATGLPAEEKQADQYVWIRQGAKNGRQRFVPLNTLQRIASIELAQVVAARPEVASVSANAFSDHNLYHLVERNLNPSLIIRAQLIRAISWFAAAALPSTAANFHVRNLIDARTAPYRGGERFGD